MVFPEGPCVAVDGYIMVPLRDGGAVQLDLFSLETPRKVDGLVLTARTDSVVFDNSHSDGVQYMLK
eukprot:2600452-Heterocapsa_arctica.AAC.1